MYLLDYECISSAGVGVQSFMDGLYLGKVHSQKIQAQSFKSVVPEGGRVSFLPEQNVSERGYQETCQKNFKILIRKIKPQVLNSKVLFIMSSTKGSVEDYIWDVKSTATATDPFHWASDFLKQELNNTQLDVFTVSNACSSSHVAVEMAQKFIESQEYDYVCVVAFDLIGPFIYSGFHALKVLSLTHNKPFASDRDGLQLGEAMAMALFSGQPNSTTACRVVGSSSIVQPSSVTRPEMDGLALVSVMQKSAQKLSGVPSFFLAHGTGTIFNDLTEDKAFTEFQKQCGASLPIVSTKWSIGHCLGASGLMDLIAASEILKNQKLFKIGSLSQAQLSFSNRYVTTDSDVPQDRLNSAIITSLGFGGMYAAVTLEGMNS